MGRVKDMHLEQVVGRWWICWLKRGSEDKAIWVLPCSVHIHAPNLVFRSRLLQFGSKLQSQLSEDFKTAGPKSASI